MEKRKYLFKKRELSNTSSMQGVREEEGLIDIFFDNIVFSLQQSGGISVVWYELLKRILKNTDLNIKFIDRSNVNNHYRDLLDIKGEKVYKSLTMNSFSRYLPVCINEMEPFVFHSSYYRLCNNPCAINITTVHDFTYEYYRSGIAKQLHSWQKFQAIKHSDAVVCISENTKKDLMKFLPDVDENKIHIIYNGVSEDYHVIDKSVGQDLPFESESYVVFVGNRSGYKNFSFVVKCLAKTSTRLVIVGSELTEDEEKMVRNHLPDNRYKSMGYMSNNDLNILYNHALALAYPSSYEGFGIPVLEAQSAGCPVIALNASSIPEVIGNTPLLMNEFSEEEFHSKLDILTNKSIRKEVIRNGLINAQRFSWDKMYNEYMTLYKTLWESAGCHL